MSGSINPDMGGSIRAVSDTFVARDHYLGHHPLPGAQIRYFVRATNGEPLAVLGFGAAAWKTAPRDEFIAWSPAVRQRNLALVVNDARFLILPWIRIPNLASNLLAQLQRPLPHDWERRYALRPARLETFCESARFLGTCYQSANWLCVGHTQERGKHDVHRQSSLPVKSVWLTPPGNPTALPHHHDWALVARERVMT